MGEFADIYDYLLDEEDEFDPLFYFNNGDEWLYENTASSRKPIVMSIRKQFEKSGFMSTKQRWVLAYWCSEQDRKYA
jgi:hypothetical protein